MLRRCPPFDGSGLLFPAPEKRGVSGSLTLLNTQRDMITVLINNKKPPYPGYFLQLGGLLQAVVSHPPPEGGQALAVLRSKIKKHLLLLTQCHRQAYATFNLYRVCSSPISISNFLGLQQFIEVLLYRIFKLFCRIMIILVKNIRYEYDYRSQNVYENRKTFRLKVPLHRLKINQIFISSFRFLV